MSLDLVERLQADAIDGTCRVPDLLRTAKLLASKLDQVEMRRLADKELSGYSPDDVIPEYRMIAGELKIRNPYRGWLAVSNVPVKDFPCFEPIDEVVELVSDKVSGSIVMGVDKSLAEAVWAGTGWHGEVKIFLSHAGVSAILNGVRNAILDWTIKLEAAGVRGDGIRFPAKAVEQARSVTVNVGHIQNASGIGLAGDHNVLTTHQSVNDQALTQRVSALLDQVDRLLASAGLSDEINASTKDQVTSVRQHLQQAPVERQGLRSRLESLGRIMEGATGNLVAVGIQAGVADLLTHF